MRAFLSVVSATAALCLSWASAADAKVTINVDKDAQQMTVAVDGVERYTWPVSTGNPSHETPNGKFQTFRMEEDHYSKEFDDAPMPHAIFFTKQGHAIHGTDSVSRLGSPASHGCVRLSRANAQTLWDIVKADGVLNTTVTLTGSSTVALARNPRSTKTARRATQPDVASPNYDAAGNPVVSSFDAFPTARQSTSRRVIQQAPGGYVYSDGTQVDASGYAVPRGYRRGYDAQGNVQAYQGGQQYYVDRGYGAQVYAPRQYYQRGYVYQD
jgi:hypothetical protein